ncbi:MAG: DUF368 domain-containing protein [Victivallales bacterium]|nr:DUF368 domain-containing protein [Victivallales bacterium]
MSAKPTRGFKAYTILALDGFAMGSANVIPGVSGGTMAFILGIYEELIDSIRRCASADSMKMLARLDFKGLFRELPWRFLIAVGTGVLAAIATMAKVLSHTLDTYPEITFSFFFGLILASIFTVLKRIGKWRADRFFAMFAGAVVAYLVLTLVPVETPHTWWNLFLCGVIVVCAMILPGISGSFLLLILGQYKYVLDAVNERNVMVLAWLALGCAAGLAGFVHLLNWLFKKFHDPTVATLIGFMAGSLWKLWPWQERSQVLVKSAGEVFKLNLPVDTFRLEQTLISDPAAKIKTLVTRNVLPETLDHNFCFAILAALAGLVIVILMERSASKKDSRETKTDTTVQPQEQKNTR